MDVWGKLDRLAECLGADGLLAELLGYIPISQLENAVEYIAWENDLPFDDDESED
jgi:hypothetical protein